MEEAGIKFVGGESAAIEEAGGKKTLVLKDGTKLDGDDEVLFAIGRDPVTDSLNLPAAGIDVGPGGHVVVDDASRTTADGVYAVGESRQGRPHSGGDRRGASALRPLVWRRRLGGYEDGLRHGADRRLLAPGDRDDGAH